MPWVAASVAFDVVFSLFIAAMLVLAAVTLTWAIRRDKASRQAWLRQFGRSQESSGTGEDR